MNKGLTLREIARLAKVSTATVSRAINRVPTVDPVLARRIRKVIEKEGYFPNTNARALVRGHSRSLGLIVSEITNPFFPEIVQTFAKLGVQHDYEILLSSIDHDPRLLETTARQMIERRVGGVAILTFGDELPLIDALTERNVPVFVVDADSSGPLLKTVQIDYEHGIRQAVQHLAALGHERIAFIGGPRDLKTATIRRSAVEKCMKEIGLELLPELFVDGDHSIEAGMKALSALAAMPDRPSAVLCSNDMTAIGVMRAAFDLCLNIPQDLSVVGFDDIRLAQFMPPPLTTVQMSQTEIAQLSFSALLDSLEPTRHGNGRQMYSMKTNLILRQSTALAPDCLVKRAATARSEADMVLKLAEKMQSRKDRTRSLEPHGRQMYSMKTNLILRQSTALAPDCLVKRAATARSEADMVLKLAEKMQSRKDRTRSLEPHGRQMYSMKTNLILRQSTALAPDCLVKRAATARSEADMFLKLAEKMQSRKDRTRSLEPHRRDMFSVPQLEST